MGEQTITERLEAGDVVGATEAFLERYGDELCGFVHATVLDEALAEEIFQDVCVEIWRALPSFRAQSSVRTWAYVITRRTTFRALRDPTLWRQRRLATSEAHGLAARWSATASSTWRSDDTRRQLWDAVATFSVRDRAIVALRVAHEMGWTDIARVLAEERLDSPTSDIELERSAAALRKQYGRLKDKLRVLLSP